MGTKKATKSTTKTKTKTKARVKAEVKATTKKQGKWRKILTIAACIIVPLGFGVVTSIITGDAMRKFGDFNQPPLAPPAWLFPVVWTILYIMMGVVLYLIYRSQPKDKFGKFAKKLALIFYFVQLALNIAWTPIFFLAEQYYFAFIWLLFMYLCIVITMICAGKLDKNAFWLLVPYLVWCTFAAYLNFGIAILN